MQAIRTMTALAALFALGSAAQAATEAEGLPRSRPSPSNTTPR